MSVTSGKLIKMLSFTLFSSVSEVPTLVGANSTTKPPPTTPTTLDKQYTDLFIPKVSAREKK